MYRCLAAQNRAERKQKNLRYERIDSTAMSFAGAGAWPVNKQLCVLQVEEKPLTLTLSPQSRGEGTGDLQRENGLPMRNPSSDAREEPLTLSPQGRSEEIGDLLRENGLPTRNPSSDAREEMHLEFRAGMGWDGSTAVRGGTF